MTSGKSGTSFQDKLAKQNEMNRQLLVRELSKLQENEKSDIRILETARQRFRCRYKKLGVRVSSANSEAYDVRMYETHNPGFCYHCTGAIKKSDTRSLKTIGDDPTDSYEIVRRLLFTNDEVDVDKILCLHLLTAHVAKNIDAQVSILEVPPLLDKGKPLTGAWNNMLPCYIVEIQRDTDSRNFDDSTDHSKLHQDPHRVSLDNETVRNFEKSYETYTRNNADIVSALTANDRLARIAPKTLGKMPIISPHVYSILGASHELRVKQAIADGYAGKKYYNKRSNVNLEILDGKSIADSFRLLDDEDDDRSTNKVSPDVSARDWVSRAGFTKIPGIRSKSRGSPMDSNYKIDRSITMLKGKLKKPVEELIRTWRTSEKGTPNDLLTIKQSYRNIAGSASETSSTKSPFRIMQNDPAYSVNSFDSMLPNHRYSTKKYRNSVYLNSPVKNFALRNEEYRTVMIFVNNRIQALVHTVLDVLEKVNPEKLRQLAETARQVEKIREIFRRQDIQNFLESLMGQPLVSSPESFVVSTATVVEEIDTRLERFLEDELVATTVELTTAPFLEMLIEEIRDNVFMNGIKNAHPTTVDLHNERSKADESSLINKSDESKLTNLVVENQRQIPSGIDGTPLDHKVPMKRKTDKFVVANKQEKKSNERIQMPGEINQLEGKLGMKIPRKNCNKIMKDSTSRAACSTEDKGASKVLNSLSNDGSQFKHEKLKKS